jgi:hypothetical protein
MTMRIRGKFAGLCVPFIAKLAGVSNSTIKRRLLGRQTLTLDDIGEIIFKERMEKHLKNIKRDMFNMTGYRL